MKVATAFVEVRPDTRNFGRDLDKEVTDKAKKASVSLGQVLGGAAFLGGANKAIDAASSLEQAVGGTAAVFGEAAAGVEEFAKGAAESAGLSERAARELTSALGGLLKGFGFTADEAANLSTELAVLGADLAATFGGTPEEAVQALGAALRGETDPLERFGIALNQTVVNQRAVELGLAATTSSVDQQAKAQATLSLITERSADAQGQFAREADTAAGQAAISAAKVENSAADLGEALLPIYSKIQSTVGTVADAFGALPEPVQTATIALAGVLALAPTVKAGFETMGATLRPLTSRLTTTANEATGAAGGLTKMGKAVGALGLIGAAAGAAAYAHSLNSVSIDADQASAALENLTAAEREQTEEVIRTLSRFGDLDETVEQLASQNVIAAEKFLEVARSAGITGDELASLEAIVDSKRAADVQGAEDQEQYAAEVAAAGDASETAAGQIEEQATALDLAKESLDAFTEALAGITDPLDMEEAHDRRIKSFNDLAADIEARAEAVEEARRRIADLKAVPVEDRPGDYERQLADAQVELQDAIDETSLSIDGHSEAALRNRETLRELTENSLGLIETAREQGASIEELELLRIQERESIRETLTELGFQETAIQGVIDKIDAVPINKTTVLDVETAEAQIRVKELLDSLNALAPSATYSVDAGIIDRNLQRAQTRALGGSVADGLFTVGEYGSPELLHKKGSRVDVIAGGQPTPVMGGSIDGGALRDLVMEQREANRLARALLAAATPSPSDTTRDLRRLGSEVL